MQRVRKRHNGGDCREDDSELIADSLSPQRAMTSANLGSSSSKQKWVNVTPASRSGSTHLAVLHPVAHGRGDVIGNGPKDLSPVIRVRIRPSLEFENLGADTWDALGNRTRAPHSALARAVVGGAEGGVLVAVVGAVGWRSAWGFKVYRVLGF